MKDILTNFAGNLPVILSLIAAFFLSYMDKSAWQAFILTAIILAAIRVFKD